MSEKPNGSIYFVLQPVQLSASTIKKDITDRKVADFEVLEVCPGKKNACKKTPLNSVRIIFMIFFE